jgi:hypothetical protein
MWCPADRDGRVSFLGRGVAQVNQPPPAALLLPMECEGRERGVRSSELILRIAAAGGDDRISVGEIVDGLRDRAYGLLLILLAVGSMIPGPPGMASVFGIVMTIFAGQLVLGADEPRLPTVVRRRSFSRAQFFRVLQRAQPLLARIERYCRPRWPRLASPGVERLAGVLVLILAIAIALPVPFSGGPLALAVVVLALGLLERDGVVVLLGLLASAGALGVLALLATIYLGGASGIAQYAASLF